MHSKPYAHSGDDATCLLQHPCRVEVPDFPPAGLVPEVTTNRTVFMLPSVECRRYASAVERPLPTPTNAQLTPVTPQCLFSSGSAAPCQASSDRFENDSNPSSKSRNLITAHGILHFSGGDGWGPSASHSSSCTSTPLRATASSPAACPCSAYSLPSHPFSSQAWEPSLTVSILLDVQVIHDENETALGSPRRLAAPRVCPRVSRRHRGSEAPMACP
jgi:hypothetical protein